jgi:hypothetical protein
LYVLAGNPAAAVVDQVPELRRRRRILYQPLQRAFAVVRLWVGADFAVPLHVGLAGKDEHLDRFVSLGR